MVSIDEQVLDNLKARKISIQELDAWEKACRFESFDNETAYRLGSLVRDTTMVLFPGKSVAIRIKLMSGQELFRCNVGQNVKLDNDNWLRRKENTVQRFGISTMQVSIKRGDLDFATKFFCDPKDFAYHGGSIPLYLVNSTYPFAILTCSGLQQEEDHMLALACVKEFTKKN